MARSKEPGIFMTYGDLELLEYVFCETGKKEELADLIMAVHHYLEFGEAPDLEGRSDKFIRIYNRLVNRNGGGN